MVSEFFTIYGEWQDILEYKDGKTIILPFQKNIICISGRILLSRFMNNISVQGIKYVAFGVSSTTPSENDTQLGEEFFRKEPDSIVYLTDSGEISGSPTKNLRINVVLDYNEGNPPNPPFEITEFGIFCDNATSTPNSGVLLNHKTHTGIVKDTSVKLIRNIILHF